MSSEYWRQVSVVVDGERVAVGSGAVLETSETGYRIYVNGKQIQSGTSTNNLTVAPHQSDVLVTEGKNTGQSISQIFEIHGDVLIACQSKPGAPRPTDFRSDPGSGYTLSVWLKMSEAESQQVPVGAQNWSVWALFVVVLGLTNGTRHDLMQNIGYWPGLLFASICVVVLMTIAGLFLSWGWQKGLALGAMGATGYFTYEELRAVIEQPLGRLGASLVAVCVAFVLAAIVAQVLSKTLKVRWN